MKNKIPSNTTASLTFFFRVILALSASLLISTSTLAVEVIVRDQQGTAVMNAVVSIPQALDITIQNKSLSRENEVPITSIDQQDLQFSPQVIVVTPGSLVNFPNSDDTRHHVYSYSEAKTFELPLYHANDAEPVEFDQIGIVKLGCNIHDNMRGYIIVSDSSMIGISDTEGLAVLPETKIGTLTSIHLQVWHPQLDEPIDFPLDKNFLISQENSEPFEVILPFTVEVETEKDKKNTLKNKLKRYNRSGA